jgi:hypothetical protein
MASVIQLIEAELPVVEVFLPVLETGVAGVLAALPPVLQTPVVNLKIGGHTYSVVVVFNKVS